MEATWWTQPDQLDEDQKGIVSLALDEDHLVMGPPGSGKTNLLILRAAHLYNAGHRDIVILTFGRVLREFLAMGTGNYKFPSDKIQTYVRWGSMLSARNDKPLKGTGKFNEVRAELLEALTEISRTRSGENQHEYSQRAPVTKTAASHPQRTSRAGRDPRSRR